MWKKVTAGLVLFAAIGAIAWMQAAPSPARAEVVEVWKSPACGCCGKWVEHMEAAGYEVKVHDTDDLATAMDRAGVPRDLGSCHTALVGGYAIEGHVPAEDVARLLREKPAGVVGLAVPGMVDGSPGMEGPYPAQRYDVVAFGADGAREVWARH